MLALSLQSCPTVCSLWTVASQAALSMGFSRQKYWSAHLQGIFLTQELNPYLWRRLYFRQVLYPLSHLASIIPLWQMLDSAVLIRILSSCGVCDLFLFACRGGEASAQCLSGRQEMVEGAKTIAPVMATPTASIPSPSAAQPKVGRSLGTWKSVHPRWPQPTAAESPMIRK